MKNIRKIAYVSIAVLVVSILAIGAVSAKAEEGNGKMFKNNEDCICIGDCFNTEVCPYDGNCLHDGQCVNAKECIPKDYDYNYLSGKN
ncbi:hypothetical protein [uncultured Methanomethylovorans sp.]|uniref:hypothetical protein n=1 Tax=uncultured Methanomethylovorans sp. TaxID=183759 RepID=UPI002AA8B3E9|nr:hypothetical protein [uncultured Methanomethylovorans sp.]